MGPWPRGPDVGEVRPSSSQLAARGRHPSGGEAGKSVLGGSCSGHGDDAQGEEGDDLDMGHHNAQQKKVHRGNLCTAKPVAEVIGDIHKCCWEALRWLATDRLRGVRQERRSYCKSIFFEDLAYQVTLQSFSVWLKCVAGSFMNE